MKRVGKCINLDDDPLIHPRAKIDGNAMKEGENHRALYRCTKQASTLQSAITFPGLPSLPKLAWSCHIFAATHDVLLSLLPPSLVWAFLRRFVEGGDSHRRQKEKLTFG